MSQTLPYATDPPRPSFLSKVFSSNLFRRGFWAMGDQGIVSIGNFITNILLVRHLPNDAFGVFVLVLEQINFLNSLQAAMVVYPMSLHGAKMAAGEFRKFATGCLMLTGMFAIPLMAVMFGFSTFVVHKSNLDELTARWLLIGLMAACATGLWQVQEMLRRALIAQIRYSTVVWGDALSYLGQAGLLGMAVRHGSTLSLPQVFLFMGVTSAAAALLQAIQIGLDRIALHDLKPLVKDFWQHGRWAAAACFATLLTASSFGWILAYKHGLFAVGAFGALGIVLKLSNPIQSSINGLITPIVSRAHARFGAAGAVRAALKYAAVGGAMLLPYYALLLLFPNQSILIATHKPEFVTGAMAINLRIFVISYSLIYVSSILSTILNGLAHSKLGFFAQALNMVITLLIALPMVWFLGVRGAVLGGLACTIGWTLASAWFLIRAVRHEERDRPAAAAV